MGTEVAISFSSLRAQLESEKSSLFKIDENIKKIVQTSGRFTDRLAINWSMMLEIFSWRAALILSLITDLTHQEIIREALQGKAGETHTPT